MSAQLVEQWPLKKLSEVIEIQNGFAFSSREYTEEGHFLIRIGNVQDGELNLNKPKYVGLDSKSSKFELSEGDLLTSLTGNIGRVARVEKSHLPAALNQRVARMKVSDARLINSDFLYYFLRSDGFRNTLTASGHGTAQKNVSTKAIGEIEIPVPPLEEQQRIVKILDGAFADIEINSKQIQSRINDSNELFSSALSEIFSCPNVDWNKAKLNEITTKIGSGATPRGGKKSYKTEGVSLIRSMNIHDKYFKHKDLAHIDESQAEKLSNVVVESNDVLLNITGASVARCNLAPREIIPARVNQHVMIIRPMHEMLSPRFLHFMLISKPYKDKLLATGEQGGTTRQAITKSQVENFEVSYPPSIQEQEGIVVRITSLLIESEKLESAYSRKLESMDELKQSILQEAFNGTL